jgi:hypothetical protein
MSSVLTSPFQPPDQKAASPNGSGPEHAAEIMTITPAMAREWTERNTRNRPVRYARVARFARDMTAAQWAVNGETIKIGTDDSIIDGQHRLYACIQAEVPFRSYVITGLPPEVQDTVDTGAARTMADQFSLRGEVSGALLAAVTRWAFLWLHGARGGRGHTAGSGDPSHTEMIALLEAEPRIREAVAWAERARKNFRSVNGSVYGVGWLLFHGSDHLAAEVFLDKILTGADLAAGHPALAFRNRIWRAREAGERLNQWEQLGYLIMAWNAFKEERTLAKLLPPRGGFTPKTFPEPK